MCAPDAVVADARTDLIDRCALRGDTRAAYLAHCAAHGVLSISGYVARLEATDAPEWQYTLDLWQRVQQHQAAAA